MTCSVHNAIQSYFFFFLPPKSSFCTCLRFVRFTGSFVEHAHSHIVGTSGVTPVSNIFLPNKKCICWHTLRSNMESQYCYCKKDCRECTISSRLKYLHVPGLSPFLYTIRPMKTPYHFVIDEICPSPPYSALA